MYIAPELYIYIVYIYNAYEIQYGSHLVGELNFCFPDEGQGPKIRTRVKNYHSVYLYSLQNFHLKIFI